MPFVPDQPSGSRFVPDQPVPTEEGASPSMDPFTALLTAQPIRRGLDLIDKGLYELGGRATDLSMRAGASPEVAAGIGTAANVGIPAIAGSAVSRLASPAFVGAARGLMQSAIKPVAKDLVSGKAARAADTLLERGINVTPGGMDQLRNAGKALNSQVQTLLQQSGKTVSKSEIGSRIQDVIGKIEKFDSTPQDSIAAVEKVYNDFANAWNIPKNIPASRANELKQGIYQTLREKYGQLGSDTEEAQKALGRGYKETLEAAVPQIKGLNAEASQIWNALNVSERRALLELNKDPGGGWVWLAHSPLSAAGYLAGKSALFKSIIARALNAGRTTIPSAVGAAVGGTAQGIQSPPQ